MAMQGCVQALIVVIPGILTSVGKRAVFAGFREVAYVMVVIP